MNEWDNAAVPATSVVYELPKPVKNYQYWRKHPKQPSIKRHYRVIQRMKRPEQKAAKKWKEGVNAGRSARDVANELAQERATGVKKVFHDYFPVIVDEDDAELEQVPVTDLPDNFIDALVCRFKSSNLDALPVIDDWEEALEDTTVQATTQNLQSLAGTFNGLQDEEMDVKPDVHDGQAARYRESAFSGTSVRNRLYYTTQVPEFNQYGYQNHLPQISQNEAEDTSDGDNTSDSEKARKKRRRFKKAKVKHDQPKVKQEEPEWA